MLISVTRQIGYAIILAAALSFAACRQADGPMPEASGTVANELGDISRDERNPPLARKSLFDDSHFHVATIQRNRAVGTALCGGPHL